MSQFWKHKIYISNRQQKKTQPISVETLKTLYGQVGAIRQKNVQQTIFQTQANRRKRLKETDPKCERVSKEKAQQILLNGQPFTQLQIITEYQCMDTPLNCKSINLCWLKKTDFDMTFACCWSPKHQWTAIKKWVCARLHKCSVVLSERFFRQFPITPLPSPLRSWRSILQHTKCDTELTNTHAQKWEKWYRFWVSYFCATPIQRKNEANLKYNRQQCCHNTMLSMCAIFQTSFKQVYDLTVNAVSYHIAPHRRWSYRVRIISAGFDMPFFLQLV